MYLSVQYEYIKYYSYCWYHAFYTIIYDTVALNVSNHTPGVTLLDVSSSYVYIRFNYNKVGY